MTLRLAAFPLLNTSHKHCYVKFSHLLFNIICFSTADQSWESESQAVCSGPAALAGPPALLLSKAGCTYPHVGNLTCAHCVFFEAHLPSCHSSPSQVEWWNSSWYHLKPPVVLHQYTRKGTAYHQEPPAAHEDGRTLQSALSHPKKASQRPHSQGTLSLPAELSTGNHLQVALVKTLCSCK